MLTASLNKRNKLLQNIKASLPLSTASTSRSIASLIISGWMKNWAHLQSKTGVSRIVQFHQTTSILINYFYLTGKLPQNLQDQNNNNLSFYILKSKNHFVSL